MIPPEPTVEVRSCSSCQYRFLPRSSPCPRCGSVATEPVTIPATGQVLAATELLVPPPGFSAPLRLVLVELEDGVRVLGTSPIALPNPGALVRVRLEGDHYSVELPAGRAG
jgi:uncharacterized OB-fold protein